MQTRRQFVTAAGTAAVTAILAPEALAGIGQGRIAQARGGRFAEGVMSGEPTPTGITLWTRLDEVSGRVGVQLEVARDREFRRVVARKTLATSGASGHAVKTRVSGLRAHEQYYYRFATRDRDSPVGRFRTALPADSRETVRFAFFSCQDYTHGYFNAHSLLAREDLDFVICLGDYIYAETYHSRAGKTGVRDDRIGRSLRGTSGPLNFLRVATSLEDYRDKYALYRSDESLRAVQARFPMVTIWDDHEVQDNYAGAEADGGLPSELRYSAARKRAAYKAFFESMPYVPPRPNRTYRQLRFGRTVDLMLMDQRQYRQDQPCGDAVVAACAELPQPRALLGRTQMDWLKGALQRSDATWKVLGNQVMAMPAKVTGDAYFGFDMWHGYPTEREELLAHIRDRQIKDVVFVTGDIHTFIAGDVRTNLGAGETVALEFVGGSVTSSGLGEIDLDAGGGVTIPGNDANPATPQAIIDTLRTINPWVDQADFDHHGYGKVIASDSAFDCELVRLQTIKRRTAARLPSAGFRWQVAKGQASIKGVNGPPAA
jgi:alkaline phosphatase D